MPTNKPRVNVTLNPSDAEVMHLICKKKNISMSALVRKVVEDWLEDYEDMLLAKRAEEAEKRWIEGGRKTISHEELCQELGIKSNMEKTQEETSRDSRKTYKKESSGLSNKGLQKRRKLANH
jgi:predicted DNA-binding protein